MKRSSKYFDLTSVVEYRSSRSSRWSPICAMYSQSSAINYAKDCADATRATDLDAAYRVVEHIEDGWTTVWTNEP